MQILNLEAVPDPGSGSRTIARFDCRVTDDLRLFGLTLRIRPDGTPGVASPQHRGERTASFSPTLLAEIASAALAVYQPKGPTPRDVSRT